MASEQKIGVWVGIAVGAVTMIAMVTPWILRFGRWLWAQVKRVVAIWRVPPRVDALERHRKVNDRKVEFLIEKDPKRYAEEMRRRMEERDG